jgi:DNA-directed RNA polymerase subunit RPC12/RpoP
MPSPPASGDALERTDCYCTECSKKFIAQLDLALDGNHIIECPYCGHEHCRVVKKGKVTDVRWSSRQQRIDVDPSRVWKSHDSAMQTSTAASFIREMWLNRIDGVEIGVERMGRLR